MQTNLLSLRLISRQQRERKKDRHCDRAGVAAGRWHRPQFQLTPFSSSRTSNLTLSRLHMEPRNGDEKVTWLRYHLGPSQARRRTPPLLVFLTASQAGLQH